jgi:hypothetical protein
MLKRNQQRGSKPRCHLLTHGSNERVAVNLARLIKDWGSVTPDDHWMPRGFGDVAEAQLDNAPWVLDATSYGAALKSWWFAAPGGAQMTPNWDLVSTCTVEGHKGKGLLLIEAKAHDVELSKEEAGRAMKAPVTTNSRRNHERIGACIRDANISLSGETRLPWALSRDWNYQMSNRFAWAWKLTELGVPVILVYLAFLRAADMSRPGEIPFKDEAQWETLVRSHSEPLFPSEVWNRRWTLHGQAFIPLIRAVEQPVDAPKTELNG